MHKSTLLPVFAGIAVSIVFGLSFMFTKDALKILAPMQLLGYRFAAAAIALTVLKACGLIKVSIRGKNLAPLLLVALFQPVLYFLCETAGVRLTSASEAGMMLGLLPVAVVVLEIPFFKTIPSFKQLFAILLSVAGIVFITVMKGSLELGFSPWGTLALIGAVVSGGLYNVLSKKSALRYTPVEITYIMMWTGALLFNGIELLQKIQSGSLQGMFTPLTNTSVLFAVLYLGVLSSVVAFFLMNYMLSKVAASQTAMYVNLTTVVAILAGILLRGESFAWFQGVGAVMIVLGVWGSARYGHKNAAAAITSTNESVS